jgi:maltooligosyltrehalose trehalohydrolase
VLLAPSPPLLFMGEEFAASTPFLFFCDFGPDLAAAVTSGRRREFARFTRFRDSQTQARIPDPNSDDTFASSKLDWQEVDLAPHREWLAHYRDCIGLRRAHIVPRLSGIRPGGAFEIDRDGVLYVHWRLGDDSRLHLAANFGPGEPRRIARPPGSALYATDAAAAGGVLEPHSVLFTLEAPARTRGGWQPT